MEKAKKEIDAEIAAQTAKRARMQTADIEGMQAAQAAERRRNLLQVFGEMLVAVAKMITNGICRFFGIETPEDRERREAEEATQKKRENALFDAALAQPSWGDKPGMGLESHPSVVAAMEMKSALDNIILATLDPEKVAEPLSAALTAIGEKPKDFDQWELEVKKTADGLFSIMSKASPAQDWKPFLEGIPTKKDAAAVVATVPRDEMDRIARAGRILEHVAAQQGQDGQRMRERFTSAAAYYALTGKDWRNETFAQEFPSYLAGDGPPRRQVLREQIIERALVLPDGTRIDLPPEPVEPEPIARTKTKIDMQGVDMSKEAIDDAWRGQPLSCEAAERRGEARMARRREIGDEAYELEISGAEPEPAYGPRM